MIVDHQRPMTRAPIVLVLTLMLPLGVFACADRGEGMRAQQMAQQAAADAEDDSTCRAKGEPGSEPYDECRNALASARAQQSAVQEQKRRDFDRVLGAGTDGLTNY